MADLRSVKKNVRQERRKDPRLEFHCNAMVLGLDGIKTITDISLGAFFIEVEELDSLPLFSTLIVYKGSISENRIFTSL